MPSNCRYYSHVINISNDEPYNESNYRYLTWVGHFVKPIIEERLHEKYWFTFYEDHGKLRIWSTPEAYEKLKPFINKSLEHPALSIRKDKNGQPVEINMTLEEDLGIDRFRPQHYSPEEQKKRSLLVLDLMNSTCELLIDSIVSTADGHFFMEENTNKTENPQGSHFQSIQHLFSHIAKPPLSVYTHEKHGLFTAQMLVDWAHKKKLGIDQFSLIIDDSTEHKIYY